jgi:hypothetical protein
MPVGTLSFSQLSRVVAAHLASEGLLVIDELPDLLKIPNLAERLVKLTLALQESGGRLLTTAQRNVLPSITQYFYGSDSAFTESPIPPMTQQDIDEMLTAAGAPPALRHPGYFNLLHGATHGHPALVAAAISFLRRNEWTAGELVSILKGDPLKEVRDETRRKIFLLLRDENLCELLYRLSLMTTSFDMELVRVVAAVTPSIPHPADLLAELTGPWVQGLASGRFEVSPLLSNAGQDTLDPSIQQKLHRRIASHYFRKRTITPTQALQIISHLLAGRDWQRLTGFLLQLSSRLREKSHAQAFEFFTTLFASWLEDIPLVLRIAFRTIQVRVLTLLEEEAQNCIDDLDAMIQQVDTPTLPTAIAALLLIGPFNPGANPVMAARKALQVRRLHSHLPSGERLLPSDISLESLIWARLTDIQTQDHIRGILAVLADMTEDERRAAFSLDLYDVRQLFIDDCWMIECLKSEDEQDWEGVLSLIAEIFQIARLPGGEPLLAPALRARAIVLADYMERPREALTVLDATPPPADNNARFLLHYTAACILLDYSTPEASLERFQQALSEGPNAYSFLQFDALRRAAETAGRVGRWELMRDFAISSVKLSQRVHVVHERLEIMGELAWAYWSLGDRLKACSTMSGLVWGLLRNRDFDNRRFREVFGKAGHVLGWMASMADLGDSPRQTADGHPYTTPFAGFFSRSRPQMADYNFPRRFDLLLTQLGWLSTGCRLYKFASRAFYGAKRLAQPQDLLPLQHLIDLELAELEAREERYQEALPLAISGIRIVSLSAEQRQRALNMNDSTPEISLQEVWTRLPLERRQEAERGLYWIIIGPAITGPAITRLFVKNTSSEESVSAIRELEIIFQQSESELAESQHWSNIFRELRTAFSSLATRETIQGQIQTLPEDEMHLRLLLYLALSRTPNATLSEICGAQAATFEFLLRQRSITQLMAEDMAVYLLQYWAAVAKTQAFALRNPQLFRRVASGLQQPMFSNVAALMLLAAHATGTQLSESLHQNLINAADSPSE